MEKTGEISSPIRIGNWVYAPATASIIPADAKKRIELILKSGLNPTQIIVGHELVEVPQLPGPVVTKPTPLSIPSIKEIKISPETEEAIIQALVTTGKVAVELAKITAVGTGMMLYGLAVALASVDPSVIVVLEDGTWVEVLSWYE
ncbi:MAG: hypothetical protein QXQ53_06585 [Candidatus Methanosuratincola sp.]